MNADANALPATNRSTRWFWINVIALCGLAPWATYWFQRHLQLYLTEIIIIGGAFSLWVFVRTTWAIFEKAAQVEPWDLSRRLLALPDVTGVLLVCCIGLAVLWFSTASLYVEYEGAPGEGEYQVEVVRKSDGSPIIPSTSLTAAAKVIGRPFLWQRSLDDLECRVLRPVKYEPLPCRLEPGRSTRISVPGSFTPREFHLLRIVPIGVLYARLAAVDEASTARYDLELESGGRLAILEGLRRQVVYTGTAANEMPIVMELDTPGALEPQLRSQLLTKRYDSSNAEVTAAILALGAREWPTFDLHTGDQIALTVRETRSAGAPAMPLTLDGLPVRYTVTADKVQTVWLPE